MSPRLASILIGLGFLVVGCTPEKRQITPTTTGSDLGNLPRGRMTPQPFPGSSFAQASRPPGDPEAIAASADGAGR